MEKEILSSKLASLKERKKELRLEHATDLQNVDAQIRELHEKRARTILRHKLSADALDREIAELLRRVKRTDDAMAATQRRTDPEAGRLRPKAASPASASSDIRAVIVDILKDRKDISESLLREKLRGKGLQVGQLSKQLDAMVASGLVRRRVSDYSLAKKH
ncbi:hypothetical protein [Thiohalomonas denitrificans]|uniref:Uncharacterized protein n=1 Tax=Thiohalomonas denitrificans TaxID=415747 RepID=A0A1G5R0G3_9GAMM|nr:hypothetical protein [Thiohalomonas denitrificans]SCZ66819.1 hypothetical protein SAMN03097708_03024 [Thiohalomonas denitrificans]